MSDAPGVLSTANLKHYDRSQSNRAVSVGALSDMHHQSTAIELVGLQKWHRWSLWAYFPLVIAIICMSCMWADIVGKKGEYSDPSGSWQSCLVNADYQYIPLNQTLSKVGVGINTAKASIKTCVITEYLIGTCSLPCVTDLGANCFSALKPPDLSSVKDIQLPTGHFLDGFSYLGIEAVIFSAIAHGSLYNALRHPSWLLSSIALQAWFFFAIFTYYTVAPILPVPNGINSTFLSYLYYSSHYGKFRSYNNGDNHCFYAMGVVWTYNVLIIGLAVTVFVSVVIGIYAERIRYKSPNKPHYTHLEYTEAPVILSMFAALSYVFFIASKLTSTITELNAIDNFDLPITQSAAGLWYPRIWFPFAVPTLDITTIVGICCVMSILRGFTIQSLTAFKLAFGCAVVYAISIYPGLVGAYQFYSYNKFYEDTTCKNFFLGANTATFGYPNEDEAFAYCQAFRMSLIAITLMAFAMHGIAVACAVCLANNFKAGRDSLVHEVYDFNAATAFHDVASARGSFAAPNDAAGTAPPAKPKPLLSRANTKTGDNNAVPESPTIPSVYTANPMTQ